MTSITSLESPLLRWYCAKIHTCTLNNWDVSKIFCWCNVLSLKEVGHQQISSILFTEKGDVLQHLEKAVVDHHGMFIMNSWRHFSSDVKLSLKLEWNHYNLMSTIFVVAQNSSNSSLKSHEFALSLGLLCRQLVVGLRRFFQHHP